MMTKLTLTLCLLFSAFCFAQELEIKGKVTEAATGMPVPGASVSVKDSSTGTTTDLDGNFTISAPKGATIVVSFIGFKSHEQVVNSSGTIAISLTEDAKVLDEVVVIGYGTQKRKEVTGAVGYVSGETISNFKPVKMEQALQGTVSGVNVTTQSGAPGAGLDIRIRGISSNGNNQPLFLVDGVIANMSFSDLNFNDVESISVLKDAQAAIYGTAGANGVILVTTKKGRKNTRPSFSYNNYIGFQETSRKLPMLNATEYALLLNEAYANGGQNIPFPDVSNLGEGTDWQDEVFDKGVPMMNHDFSVSGGTDKSTYFASGSHFEQGGIIGGDKSNYERNTARVGMTVDLFSNLKLTTNASYMWLNRKAFSENTLGSVLFNALNTPAVYTPYDADGNFTVLPTGSTAIPASNLGNEIINPLAQIANTFNFYKLKRQSYTVQLDYDPIKDLTVTGRFGYNGQDSHSRSFSPQVSYGGKVFDNVRSRVDLSMINDNDWTFDLFVNYKKTIAETHHFNALLGHTTYRTYGDALFNSGFDIPNNAWENADISLTTGFQSAKTGSSYTYDIQRVSYFGRLQYDYKEKYLVSAMLRRDASARFGPDYRAAWFPSFTGGWVLSQEEFYPQNNIVSFAKFRASYGRMGNDLIGDFRYLGLLGGEATYVFNGQLVNGVAQGALPNKSIRWEEDRKFDAGIDLKLLSDKVDLTIDYFRNKRSGLLIQNIPISGVIGTNAPGGQNPTLNAGDVLNKGWEFALSYKDKAGDDFSYNVSYTAAFYKNEVTRVDNGTGFYPGGGFGVGQPQPTRMEVGQPMGYFYGYETDGLFQTQAEIDNAPSQYAVANVTPQAGDIRFKDVNGDGVVDTNDRTKIGKPTPDATMGINIQLNYKGFDFVGYGFASIGNDMIRNYERTLTDVNHMNYVLDRWTGEGTSNSVPRVTTGATANNVFSDYFVEDASYFRIQNVQLGYTVNPEFTKKAYVEKLRVYVGANNLYTFTKYRGYDPGASSGDPLSSGIDYGFYPVSRTFLFGVNLNF